MIDLALERKHLIRKIQDTVYYNHKLIEINLELEEVATKLYSVGSPVYTDMPRNDGTKSYLPPYALMEKEERLIKKRNEIIQKMTEVSYMLKTLSDEVKDCVIRLYILDENQFDVAESYNLARSGLMYRIETEIDDIVRNSGIDGIKI